MRERQQYFKSSTNYLVHDPNASLLIGDVVSLHRLRVSSAVHHVVAAIVAPFGTPISARPPIPSPDERLAAYKAKRFRKLERRDLRRRAKEGEGEAVRVLAERGLSGDVDGEVAEEGKGGKGGKKEEEMGVVKEREKVDWKARREMRKVARREKRAVFEESGAAGDEVESVKE